MRVLAEDTCGTLLLARAIGLAAQAHNNQTRRNGDPYILHPLRVMHAVEQYGIDAAVVGVLHDVVEDTSVTIDTIQQLFGARVRGGVDAVTRRERETYTAFIERAAEHPIGRLVKIADIADNITAARTLRPGEAVRYGQALATLLEKED